MLPEYVHHSKTKTINSVTFCISLLNELIVFNKISHTKVSTYQRESLKQKEELNYNNNDEKEKKIEIR